MLGDLLQGFRDYWQVSLYRLPLIILAILVFVIFLSIAKVTKSFLNKLLGKTRLPIQERFVINYALRITIIVIGTILSLAILGVNLTGLVATVGFTGLILGFALQDVIKNFLSGIIILVQKPFKIGDRICVDSVSGNVKKISARSTVIRTFDGNHVIIPNQKILNKKITCPDAYLKKRSDFTLAIRDDNSIKRAVEKGLEALKQTPGVKQDPGPEVRITKIERGRIYFRFFFWWTKYRQKNEILDVKSLALKNVKEKFDREEITLIKSR